MQQAPTQDGPAAAAPAKTMAQEAEDNMRAFLGKNKPRVDVKGGKLQPGSQPSWVVHSRRQCSCDLPPLVDNPAGNPAAQPEDYYRHGQDFAVMHPVVSMPAMRCAARWRARARWRAQRSSGG